MAQQKKCLKSIICLITAFTFLLRCAILRFIINRKILIIQLLIFNILKELILCGMNLKSTNQSCQNSILPLYGKAV